MSEARTNKTNREKYKEYIKNGGKMFASPQIGAGAGFDTKLAGKEWISQTTFEDLKNACKKFNMIPLYNFGMIDLASLIPDECHWENLKSEEIGDRKYYENRLHIGKYFLDVHLIEDKIKGFVQTKNLITEEDELKILDYYLDRLLEVTDFTPVVEHVKNCRNTAGEDEAIDIQWAMQPYELFCFPDTMNTAIFAFEQRDIFIKMMEKILRIDENLIKAVALGGSDFVFLGGPGSEMISPKYYEDFLVPYSEIVTSAAHKENLLIYSHICSPIEPMLTKGYYNQMGIDLFETLSPEPVGNIKSLEDAFNKLSPDMCTRGNIGLDRLLLCSPDEIRDIAGDIVRTAEKLRRKHILAASDYLFYDVPEENVHAMCDVLL
ncbi:MAG: uroporphyrinogen decarboxylase family protein [Oscillospiraceae bacterium]|nr:uroporphyrinogen decarboxylase family protein [Oscillospiraceae bacterium]